MFLIYAVWYIVLAHTVTKINVRKYFHNAFVGTIRRKSMIKLHYKVIKVLNYLKLHHV